MRYSPWAEVSLYPDVTVHRTNALGDLHGLWCPDSRVILLNRSLGRIEARCALAHELAHAIQGHHDMACHPDGDRLNLRLERDADRAAARKLINLHDLGDVRCWAMSEQEAALALSVTGHMLYVRLANLTAGEACYLQRRSDPLAVSA